ncbi:MAG: acetoacetate--CoA ligase [Gammaproteobacteria bacterium]|nr:acetoacetate--CoA ligase [Gammaproteobacteria bacterium]
MNNPVWTPENPENTAMTRFMRTLEQQHAIQLKDYAALHTWSIQNTALFWEAIADFFKLNFKTPPQTILKETTHMMDATWFEGATLNVAEHLLKRSDDHPALISINEAGNRDVLSYHALKEKVASCAAGLRAHGVQSGDRVIGMLPNSAFAVIAMLATASIGAIWSACSPDFGIPASVDRLSQITPKLLFVCDGYTYHGKNYDLKDKAEALLAAIPSIETLVICPVLSDGALLDTHISETALSWDDFLQPNAPFQTEAYAFNHPWYILFSSGTTGQPKCIVHSTGGTLLQHVKELGLQTNLTENDTFFFHTTCGWMMWNWMVSGLALGATLVLYDGSPMFPKIDSLFQLLEDESVSVFGTGARFLAAIEKRGLKPNETLTFSKLHTILSTGSPLLPQQYDFVRDDIKQSIQLSSISGGTDIVSCFALGNPISPVYRGELQCLGLGMNVQVFNEQGQSTLDAIGELVCTKPFPSMPVGFWNDPDRIKYEHAYFERFPGIWAHGDLAARTEHGGLIIYGRSDAVLNPGGVRIGTAEIYRPLENLPEIQESIVIGQPWQGDVRVILFIKLQQGFSLDKTLRTKIRQTIRNEASPRHVPAKILEVLDIPRTINGKIVEVAARQTVQGEVVQNLSSLENPESLEYFKNRPELMASAIERT